MPRPLTMVAPRMIRRFERSPRVVPRASGAGPLSGAAMDSVRAWAATGDAQAPQYRKIAGLGSVDEITARALAALA